MDIDDNIIFYNFFPKKSYLSQSYSFVTLKIFFPMNLLFVGS